MEVDEVESNEKNGNVKLQGFVSLDAAAREKPISLKSLFESNPKLDDKNERRKRVNRKKKESAKRRKLVKETRENDEKLEKDEIEKTSYRFSANREIMGRVVAGDQSFIGGHGIAIGYICAEAINRIAGNYLKSKSMVLVRNSTSKYYHPAIVRVLHDHVDL
ncbi:unnamed protein product [Caenorhabditis bovis]|uniref:POP1 C-terminal domain-containing protein n=1 Tax=Caenorhabditis bovis TaxID=2654633 RepID=A0A8S1ERS8_9PELO|nr:unnamed protein product [Caenorhabditis bovis]